MVPQRHWLHATLLALAGVTLALTLHGSDGALGLAASYLRAVGWALLFVFSSLVAGHALVTHAFRRTLPFEEHLTIAFALGVFSFFGVGCLFGFSAQYGWRYLLLGPASLLAFGFKASWRTAVRLRRHLARVELRWRSRPLHWVVFAFGVIGLLLLWGTVLTPENASYDARWYHLALAEEYVARGGIQRFSEGWIHGAFPQLATLLYAWAFSTQSGIFDRVITAAHLELSVFLMTLVGVSAVVRRVLGRRSLLAWVAVLLFPGIYCYDSGLVLGADHVAALWACPIFLVLLRHREQRTRSSALLLGAFLAAALNTKYTAVILLPLPIVCLAYDAAKATGQRKVHGSGAAWITTSLVVLTSPFWLRNAIFYSDPLFPAFRHYLPSHPWALAEGAAYQVDYALYHPVLSGASVLECLKTLATFSFVPHDFPAFHGAVPVFGSLFTVLTPLALLVTKRTRLRLLLVGCYLGLFAWFWLHQLDRYLQVLVPWMAAATAVVLQLVWEEGGLLRPLAALTVALQVAWGATLPFRFVHRAAGMPIYQSVLALLALGRTDSGSSYDVWEHIGRNLPGDARVLVHEEDVHLGLARVSLRDTPGDQGVFYWGEPGVVTAAQVWGLLKAQGVSHLAWANEIDHGSSTLASALVFFDFTKRYTEPVTSLAGFSVAAITKHRPPEEQPGRVGYFGCDSTLGLATGLYELNALSSAADEHSRRALQVTTSVKEVAAGAHFLVFDPGCQGPLPVALRDRFQLLARRGHTLLFEQKDRP